MIVSRSSLGPLVVSTLLQRWNLLRVSQGLGFMAGLSTRPFRHLNSGVAVAWLAIPLAAFVVFVTGSIRAAEASRPNFVVIICDDMGFSDLGCYGGEIQTPNIDQLAEEGMRFTHFYNSCRCGATRTELVTGLYARQGSPLTRQMVTLGQVLGQRGYRSSVSGKWNVQRQDPSTPLGWGFEEFYGMPDGGSNCFDPARPDLQTSGSPGFQRIFMHNERRLTEFPEEYYLTDAISDHAVEMIHRFSDAGDPFLVYVGYTCPHSPLQAKPEDIARYKNKFTAGWDKLRRERRRRLIEMGLIDRNWPLPAGAPDVTPWEQAAHHDWQDTRMAVYCATIDSMDQGIGRIRKALADTGADENTVVLFLSDNGPASADINGPRRYIGDGLGDGPDSDAEPGSIDSNLYCGAGWAFLQATPFRRFKVWTHEGGIATPLVAWAPGLIPSNSVTHEVGHVIDIMPTLAQLAGAKYPHTWQDEKVLPCEGKSLAPLLRGGGRDGHDELFWYDQHIGAAAIRERKWKLVSEGVDMPWELYDMEADRTETNDLSHDNPDRVHRMTATWYAWAQRMGLEGKLPPR